MRTERLHEEFEAAGARQSTAFSDGRMIAGNTGADVQFDAQFSQLLPNWEYCVTLHT
jgi:hypothetical protein